MNDNRFYVYVYLDQRKAGCWIYKELTFEYQPFYVGKGTKNRDLVHLQSAMLNQRNHKSSTIKSIIKEVGELPLHRRIYENVSAAEAAEIEQDFIHIFGRKDIATGILCNHTDGGDGSHNLSPESIKRISVSHCKPIYQYSLDGKFLKKWKSLMEVDEKMMINTSNIPSSVERNGTSNGYIWSYHYLGKKICGRIKHQTPMKYQHIKQVSLKTGKIVEIYPTISSILKKFGVSYQHRNLILDCLNGTAKSALGYYWTTKDVFTIPTKKSARGVCQFTRDDIFLGEYKSITEASRVTGYLYDRIWECCQGKRPYVGESVWKYKI